MRPLHRVGVIRLPSRSAAAVTADSGRTSLWEDDTLSTTISRLVSRERLTYDPPAVRSGRWSLCAAGGSSNEPYPAGFSVVAADAECLRQQLVIVWERLRGSGVGRQVEAIQI